MACRRIRFSSRHHTNESQSATLPRELRAGDAIMTLDGATIRSARQLLRLLRARHVTVKRNGQE